MLSSIWQGKHAVESLTINIKARQCQGVIKGSGGREKTKVAEKTRFRSEHGNGGGIFALKTRLIDIKKETFCFMRYSQIVALRCNVLILRVFQFPFFYHLKPLF